MALSESQYQGIYDEALAYLLSFDDVDEALVERHLSRWEAGEATSLDELFRGFLTAAQNRQGMPNAIGDIDALADVLYGFSPSEIVQSYDSWEGVFSRVERGDYTPPGRMERDNSRNYWVQFSKSILSGAEFFSRFDTIDEANAFVESFYSSEYTRYSLPLLLSKRIHGLGFALACDFLKENGYPEFVKPDVHLKDLFVGLGLSEGDDDFDIFLDIIRFAEVIDERPYRVDKLFWLVGSGRFYLETPTVRVSTDKQAFIERVKTR